jgi:hypothetical protein
MANLSRSQLTGLAQSVGFTGNDVNIAVAVALAESGGNPGAHNSTPPDDSYGLWQINMLGSLGPSRRKKFGILANTDLFRPATNAKAAKIIHGESGWKAWTTYTSGKYKEYLTSDPQLPTGQIPNTPGKTVTPEKVDADVAEQQDGPLAGLNAISAALTKATANVSGYLVALVLGVLGVVLLLRNAIPIPVGKIVKVAKKL